jgi:hypothetical protein
MTRHDDTTRRRITVTSSLDGPFNGKRTGMVVINNDKADRDDNIDIMIFFRILFRFPHLNIFFYVFKKDFSLYFAGLNPGVYLVY